MCIQPEEQQTREQNERISLSDQLSPKGHSAETKIKTTRLILRRPALEDVDVISKLANNIAVAQMLSRMPHPYTQKDAEEFVARVSAGKFGKHIYAITLKDTGDFIGGCGFNTKDGTHPEIGYWLGEPFWGQGYATEAAHALVDAAFNDPKIEQLVGRCRIGNLRSRHVLQKCGFQFSGTGVGHCLAENAAMPMEVYHLDRHIWASIRNWPQTDGGANRTDKSDQDQAID